MTETPWKPSRDNESGEHAGNGVNLPAHPSIVRDLRELIARKAKFPTIYADPPWPYTNTAARGAGKAAVLKHVAEPPSPFNH